MWIERSVSMYLSIFSEKELAMKIYLMEYTREYDDKIKKKTFTIHTITQNERTRKIPAHDSKLIHTYMYIRLAYFKKSLIDRSR